MADDILPVIDADGNNRNLDAEFFSPGPNAVDDVLRERVQIAGVLADGTDIAEVAIQRLSINDRTNTPEVEQLASASRTATTNTPEISSGGGGGAPGAGQLGVQIVLNVTANPGGGQTLAVKLQATVVSGSVHVDWVDFGVLLTAANGTKVMTVYPGGLAADLVAANAFHKAVPVPRDFRVVVTHSGGGSWTYSLYTRPFPQ